MKTFPMFLKTSGRRIVIVGGAEQAAQKCRLALKTDAEVVVAAKTLDPELQSLAREGRIRHHAEALTPDLFRGAALVFVATGCRGADAAAQALAKIAGALVNVVDAPDLCDAFTPSIVDRDPVVVAIGTEGAAPVLARRIKSRVEEMLEPRLGDLAALAGRMRAAVAQRVPQEKRRAFWRWVFTGAPRIAHARGAEREAAALMKQAVAAGGAPKDSADGLISVLGVTQGAPDLLTLRAAQRLQEADVIFYDREIDRGALELARRDAERVELGAMDDAFAQGAEAVLIAAAREGKRVVRLCAGAPLALASDDVECEIIDAAQDRKKFHRWGGSGEARASV